MWPLLLAGVALLVSWLIKKDFSRMIWADAEGYYQYLTAVFIHHDLKAQPYAYFLPDGTAFNKYTYGVALMQLPFFLAGMLVNMALHLPHDGYTAVNGFFITLASVTYTLLGIRFLWKTTASTDRTGRLAGLGLLFLASNLFFYTLVESGLSHSFSFFLIAWFLYRVPPFLQSPSTRNTLWCALPLALAVIVRPTNAVAVLFIFLYDINHWKELVGRLRWFFSKAGPVVIFLATAFLLFLPQMYYWHLTTGRWLVYSYHYSYTDNETFRFWAQPRMLAVLAGPRSGWLVYSPVMLLSLAGMVRGFIIKAPWRWAVPVIFVLIWYINASWWSYTFACGFGYRSFVDFYGLMALPFLVMVQDLVWRLPSRHKLLLLIPAVVLVYLNIRLSVFYDAIPCWDGPGWGWEDVGQLLMMMAGME